MFNATFQAYIFSGGVFVIVIIVKDIPSRERSMILNNRQQITVGDLGYVHTNMLEATTHKCLLIQFDLFADPRTVPFDFTWHYISNVVLQVIHCEAHLE